MGAPLGASFLGLLLMRGGDAAAADDAGGRPAAPATDAELDLSAGFGAGQQDAGMSLGLTMPLAPAAGLGGFAAIDAATAVGAGTGDQPLVSASSTPTERAPLTEAAATSAEPPALPDIGDVTLAFGSEAPFALPEAADLQVGFPEENIGDLGDPRDVVREPIAAPETDATDGGSGDGPPASVPGNPGLKITGTPQNDYLVGSDGDDVIDTLGGKNTVLAGAGDDIVYGGPGNDLLRGGPGNDTIYGVGGTNEIHGDAGDNLLFGGTGNDTIFGGPGNDRLDGGGGLNKLYAGTGNNTLVVNDWRDIAVGNNEGPNGGGTDTLEVASGFAASLRGKFSSLSADGSTAFVMGAIAAGRSLPGDINDFKWQVDARIDQVRLTGDDSHDVVAADAGHTIWGNDGDNRLYGGAGDDVLHAGGGNDYLYGGDGDDMLYGGADDNALHGGDGDDLFVFGLAEGGKNTVFDHQGVNRIRIDGLDDPAQLEAHMDGNDLVLGHAGAEIVRIDDHASHREAFAGLEHGGQIISFEQLLQRPVAAATATSTGGEDDLLSVYLGPQSVEADDDILDPAWLEDDGPGHDAPFALYEEAAGDFARSPAEPSPIEVTTSGSTDDMLGSFMRGEPLWLGPEDGLYVLDSPAVPSTLDEPQHGRG